MKVVAFNDSPRKDGNTYALMRHVLAEIEAAGIQTEMVQVGGKKINALYLREERSMALFRTVSEAEATGKVKAVYDDIKATKKIDVVPNFWKALSVNPEHLEAVWQKLKVVMKPGKLDPLTKEIIALAVSITNNCEY